MRIKSLKHIREAILPAVIALGVLGYLGSGSVSTAQASGPPGDNNDLMSSFAAVLGLDDNYMDLAVVDTVSSAVFSTVEITTGTAVVDSDASPEATLMNSLLLRTASDDSITSDSAAVFSSTAVASGAALPATAVTNDLTSLSKALGMDLESGQILSSAIIHVENGVLTIDDQTTASGYDATLALDDGALKMTLIPVVDPRETFLTKVSTAGAVDSDNGTATAIGTTTGLVIHPPPAADSQPNTSFVSKIVDNCIANLSAAAHTVNRTTAASLIAVLSLAAVGALQVRRGKLPDIAGPFLGVLGALAVFALMYPVLQRTEMAQVPGAVTRSQAGDLALAMGAVIPILTSLVAGFIPLPAVHHEAT